MLPNVLQRTDADHIPVLAAEVRELLAVRPGETVVDATFGAGGHARLLAEDLGGEGRGGGQDEGVVHTIALHREALARPHLDHAAGTRLQLDVEAAFDLDEGVAAVLLTLRHHRLGDGTAAHRH